MTENAETMDTKPELKEEKKAFLVLVRGEKPKAPDLGRRYEIPQIGASIGNLPGVEIPLSLGSARCHVQIVYDFGAWHMNDVKAGTGVLINGILTQKCYLRDGDILQVGPLAFEFCSDAGIKRDFFEQNEEARRVDILTQAYNRATILWFIEKDLQRYNQWESERRYLQGTTALPPISLIMLDIDHFGAFNKTYDHLIGDQVLRGVIDRVKARVRGTDMVGRYGGEEFLVYLPNTTLSQGLELAESIRQRVASSTFVVEPHNELSVTISLGVAQFEPGMSPEDFIRAANVHMKMAKEMGRNRVVG